MMRILLLLSLVALIKANALHDHEHSAKHSINHVNHDDHSTESIKHSVGHHVNHDDHSIESIKHSIDDTIQSIQHSVSDTFHDNSLINLDEDDLPKQTNNHSWLIDDLHPKSAPSRSMCRSLVNHVHVMIEDGHENVDRTNNKHRDLRVVLLIDHNESNNLPAILRADVELSFKPHTFDFDHLIKQSIKVHSSVDADDTLHNLLRARMVYRMLPHSIDQSIDGSIDQPLNIRFDKLISFLPSFQVDEARIKFSLHGDSFECRSHQRVLMLDKKYGAAWSNQTISPVNRHTDHVQQTRSSLSSLFNVIGSMLSATEEPSTGEPTSADAANPSPAQPVKPSNNLPYDLGEHEILIDQSIACSNLSLSYTARFVDHHLYLSLMTSSVSPVIEKVETIIVPPSVRIHGVSKPFLMKLIDQSHQSIYQLDYALPRSLWWQPKSRFHYDFRVKLLHESLVCRFAGRGTGTHDASPSPPWQSERVAHQLHSSSNQTCPWKDTLSITASTVATSHGAADMWQIDVTSSHVLDWAQLHVFVAPHTDETQVAHAPYEAMMYMQQTQLTSEQLAALTPRTRALEKDKQSKRWFRVLPVPMTGKQLMEMRLTVSHQGVPCDTNAKISKVEQFAISWNVDTDVDAVTSWIVMPVSVNQNEEPLIHHPPQVNDALHPHVTHPPVDHPHHPAHHPHYQHDDHIDQLRHVEIDPFEAANQFATNYYHTQDHSINQQIDHPEQQPDPHHPQPQLDNHHDQHQHHQQQQPHYDAQHHYDTHATHQYADLDVHPGHHAQNEECDFWCQMSGVCQGCLVRSSFNQAIPEPATCNSCISVLQCNDDPCRIEKACELCHVLPISQRPTFCQQIHC